MYFRNSSQNDHFIFNGIKLPNSFEEKVLIIIFDNELEFEPHIRNICKKTAHKLGVLSRLLSFLDPKQKGFVFNAVIKSDINYYPLLLMFSCRNFNKSMNRIGEKITK